ncbi:FAD-dependent oxidoreductase [Adhaeribacter rhizoryzae]|uniref:FAD-dependent oxidoreductase n=1 Tax=Adhaeribacter rhizoryzae TaxID=2607907 RepID=A0A5M6DGX3_9BACT|nr:FAD-dependent oxidoreductase [Adhaeribacter rhizoryzae]KAA5546804.1 FAD-dependent oxidoreductase [Adhaeribacter rhizoryzae]
MININRRKLLKSIGLASVGAVTPNLLKGERLSQPYQVNAQKLKTDILVIGGGTAGVIAAIQAGRAGAKVILVENGSQLGGTTTTGGVNFPGIFFAWGKQVIGGIGWELVQEAVAFNDDVLPDFSVPHGQQHWKHQVRVNKAIYTILAEEKCLNAGVKIRYYETPTSCVFKNNTWVVQTVGKGTSTEITCNQLIDCTGNAYAASIAGFPLLREAETQPGTLNFQLGGYDFDALDKKQIQEAYLQAIKKGELSKPDFKGNIIALLKGQGDNNQHVAGADSTTSDTHTLANIQGRASLIKHLRFLRTLPGCEKMKLIDMQQETAVRETFRIDGLYKITQEDFVTGKKYDDAVSYSYYPIDLHDEHGVVPNQLKNGTVPTIPLRALIPRNSRNFMVAGRSISSDRLANSALRVQASCMGMGQAAGAVAVLANNSKKTPHEVPMRDIRKLIQEHGGIVPA